MCNSSRSVTSNNLVLSQPCILRRRFHDLVWAVAKAVTTARTTGVFFATAYYRVPDIFTANDDPCLGTVPGGVLVPLLVHIRMATNEICCFTLPCELDYDAIKR